MPDTPNKDPDMHTKPEKPIQDDSEDEASIMRPCTGCPGCRPASPSEIPDTSVDLGAIEARANAATPGPWFSSRDGNQYINTRYIHTAKCVGASRIDEIRRPWNPRQALAFGMPAEKHEVSRFLDSDADFIAHARQDIPALIALARSQAVEIERLRRALQNIRKRCFDDSEWARYIDAVSPPPWSQVKPQQEGDYWRWEPGWRFAFYCQVSRLDEGDPLCIFGEERDERIADVSPNTWWLKVDRPPIPSPEVGSGAIFPRGGE